jgi:hypothetical protein
MTRTQRTNLWLSVRKRAIGNYLASDRYAQAVRHTGRFGRPLAQQSVEAVRGLRLLRRADNRGPPGTDVLCTCVKPFPVQQLRFKTRVWHRGCNAQAVSAAADDR